MKNKYSSILLPIVLLISLSQLNETIYANSLPEIEIDFKISNQFLEYTLTSYFLGFGIGTLFWGYISDLIGRKKCIAIGSGAYITGCFFCWGSNLLAYLIIARFIQGFGVSFASVLGQALIRDLVRKKDRPKIFNNINIIISFVPAIGLTLGMFLIKFLGWRFIFITLIFIGFTILVLVTVFIPNIQVIQSKRRLFKECFNQIIKDVQGLKLGGCVGGSLGVLFGYYVASGYFFRVIYTSSLNLSLISVFVSLALLSGAIISKKTYHYSPDAKIFFATLTAFMFSLLFYSLVKLSIISNSNSFSISLSLMCIFPILASTSVIIPNCLSRILNNYGRYTGTASSIYGFYYYIVTAFFINIFNFIDMKSIEGLPTFMLFSSLLMLAMTRLREL